jgi:hypothetical protein
MLPDGDAPERVAGAEGCEVKVKEFSNVRLERMKILDPFT